MAKNTSHRTWGGWDWFGLVVICIIVILISLPNINRAPRGKAKEAETKNNLYAIQLAVERFAVDNEGEYPKYLIGGTPADAFGTPGTIPFTSDILLREGYLTSYPKNPFMRHTNPKSLELQANLPSSITGNDPLRPGDPEGDLLGYRFGKDGDIMGQVLCDPRYEKWTFTVPFSGKVEQRDTWAIIEYPFWDTWNGKKHEPEFLPGMFFYKSFGPMIEFGGTDDAEIEKPQDEYNEHLSLDGNHVGPYNFSPTEVDQYMVGAYGSIRTKGKDVLGEEQQLEGWLGLRWTLSAYSATDLGGSPFHYFGRSNCGQQHVYGNPNGIPDGLILILTAGEDYHSH